MSQPVVNFSVPVALNWNEHSAGSAMTVTGAASSAVSELRIGEVGDALEDREVGQRREHEAGQHDRLAADLVRQPAEQDEAGRADRQRHRDHDLRGDARHLQRLGQEEQRIELAAVPDHRLAGGGAEQREQSRSWRCSIGRRPPSAALRALALVLHLGTPAIRSSLQPDPDRNRQQDGREQERHAPAPVAEGLFAHARCGCRGSSSSARNRPSVAVV